jgi:hypothetical protein
VCPSGGRYQYELAVAPGGFTARARGDLNCDGVFSTFEVLGWKEGAHWRFSEVRARRPFD